ncbi:ABC-type nitrate/sulfonate/bicarbonate transport system, substrate-binding protein [Acetitomaculum ruminis DSM 5522]|uniref:ABC-type nitrate/sulfonate/bicarbonate transport system, substrate-binding protein n=1 Tax=Acetitomaculum ruminis DSM 5522 TaxID=1120918 RepID=A0A1I0YV14_9FIRM|nr:ABC transporter substrate-binding protein [Acetitomaculum ruminis]SFB16847.1 ABC-type nitrate/sulfonate/bicarbonate transport system, substrate-binding protein [Acetitomaculum ruminis DSM 5522]
MNNKKLKITAIVAIMAIVIGIVSFGVFKMGNASKNENKEKKEFTKITFCLDWTPNTNHTGLFVAKGKGYFEEEGLEVEFVQPPEDGALLMCSSGQAQFAIDAQDTFAAALDGDKDYGVTAISAILQHNTSGIISRKGDGIVSPAGLEGKTYSTWESPIEMAMIKNVMEEENADFDKLKLIPNTITDEPAALAAKQTDAIWVFYGWGGINADIEKVDCDFFFFRDINPVFDYCTPVIFGNNEFMESNPEITKAFLRACKKGYEYAVENPDDAADILIKEDSTNSLQGADKLVHESQKWISKEYISDAKSWGYIDSSRWDRFYKWLYDNKLTKNNLSKTGYTNEYLSE